MYTLWLVDMSLKTLLICRFPPYLFFLEVYLLKKLGLWSYSFSSSSSFSLSLDFVDCISLILASWDCYDRLPQTGWLRTTLILTVLVARNLKLRCWQGWFLLNALRENSFSASLLTSGSYWQPFAFPDFAFSHSSVHMTFLYVFVSDFPLLPVIGFRAYGKSRIISRSLP